MRGYYMKLFTQFRWIACFCIIGLLVGCATVPELGSYFDGEPGPNRKIVIDLTKQRAFVYDGSRLLASSPISSGREGKDTPTGQFTVIQKSPDHRSSIYGNYVRNSTIVKANVDSRKDTPPAGSSFEGAPMPYFLRFSGAYGLHAGFVPSYPASNGCVRLPNRQAKRFYDAVLLGTPVLVHR